MKKEQTFKVELIVSKKAYKEYTSAKSDNIPDSDILISGSLNSRKLFLKNREQIIEGVKRNISKKTAA